MYSFIPSFLTKGQQVSCWKLYLEKTLKVIVVYNTYKSLLGCRNWCVFLISRLWFRLYNSLKGFSRFIAMTLNNRSLTKIVQLYQIGLIRCDSPMIFDFYPRFLTRVFAIQYLLLAISGAFFINLGTPSHFSTLTSTGFPWVSQAAYQRHLRQNTHRTTYPKHLHPLGNLMNGSQIWWVWKTSDFEAGYIDHLRNLLRILIWSI